MNSQSPSMTKVLAHFLRGPGDHYDGLAEMVEMLDSELLDDHSEIQTLIPVGEIPHRECHVCFTDFDNAPFLISTRAKAALKDDPEKSIVVVTRRFATIQMPDHQLPEQEIFEWVSDFTGVDPVRANEADGNYTWTWPIAMGGAVVKDEFRLFVAVRDGMMILDRIATAAALTNPGNPG